MNGTITLNETQMKLLREYAQADAAYQAAHVDFDKIDIMSPDFKRASNLNAQTYNDRARAAAVFAASVVVDLKGEVAHV